MANVTKAALVYLSKWPEKSDTRRTMRQALDRAAALLGEDNDTHETFQWQNVRYADARALPAMLFDEDLAPATINKILSAVRGVLETARALGLMSDEDFRKIEIENVAGNTEQAGRALPSEEIDALYTAVMLEAMSDRAAMIAVLAATGVRRVELMRLIVSDYDIATKRLHARGKGNKKREIPVAERWQKVIENWVWLSQSGKSSMFTFETKNPRREISYIVERFCFRHKLKPFTPHDLRRTFGTHVEKVAGIAVAQKLLGHNNIRTTALYVRVDEAREAAAVKDL